MSKLHALTMMSVLMMSEIGNPYGVPSGDKPIREHKRTKAEKHKRKIQAASRKRNRSK